VLILIGNLWYAPAWTTTNHQCTSHSECNMSAHGQCNVVLVQMLSVASSWGCQRVIRYIVEYPNDKTVGIHAQYSAHCTERAAV
jgi:hypothetical protein